MKDTIEISTIVDHGELDKSIAKWLWQQLVTGNSDMAAKTGNIYISGTMTDRIETSTANLGVSTTPSSKKRFPTDYDNDRQPAMSV